MTRVTRVARIARAFTLVELLVVIGIIALLIAILMPALSRARKQALQVSCGSNERQVTYAALAYGNDWEEQLPTLWGNGRLGMHNYARLPIIGFDTTTIWDWATYLAPVWPGRNMLGGWAFTVRDYLKNDWDVYACPDGYYNKADFLHKWGGQTDVLGPCYPCCCYAGSGDWSGLLMIYGPGYTWLPHREISWAPTCATACGGPIPVTDEPGEIAKTASDLPGLLILADFNEFGTRYYAGCGLPAHSGCGVIANHNGSSYRRLPTQSGCMPEVFPPNIGREENPMQMPLGMNRSRIDARVKWLPWQDWDYYRWSNHDYGSDGAWYSW